MTPGKRTKALAPPTRRLHDGPRAGVIWGPPAASARGRGARGRANDGIGGGRKHRRTRRRRGGAPDRRRSGLAWRAVLRIAAAPRHAARGRFACRPARGAVRRARLGRSVSVEPRRRTRVLARRWTPHLLDFGGWARFFIAIGLFMLSEQQIEYGLNGKLGQLVRAPIIAPECFAAAASAVVRALRLRDSRAAEIICLGLAIVGTVVWLTRLTASRHSSWAVEIAGDGAHVTLAGWWSVICSAPLFYFLLFRGLWRYIVWAMLLWRIASSSSGWSRPIRRQGRPRLSRRISERLFDVRIRGRVEASDHRRQACVRGQHPSVTFGYIITAWLAIVFAFFAFPLLAFSKPWPSSRTDRPRSSAPGAPLPPRRGARPDRAQLCRQRFRGSRGAASPIRRRNSPPRASCRASMSRSAVAPLAFVVLVPSAIAARPVATRKLSALGEEAARASAACGFARW